MTGARKSPWLWRRGNPTDERGTMAILLMVMIVGLMLSALLVPMIITANRTTRFDSTRVQALNAAQAGVDVTLGLIRASVGTDGIGITSKLPCTDALHPFTGLVNSTGLASYSVVVEYFRFDPVTDPYPSPNAMKCISLFGPYDPASGATTPGFARFTSVGTVGTANNGSTVGRTVTSTYVFRTSNNNILGGLLQISPASAGLCMDVGSSTAPAGTPVVLQACTSTTPPAAQQVFAYRTDLTLQLLSSITAANPNGLCLTSTAHSPPAAGDALVLGQCAVLGSPLVSYTQLWSYNDNGQYQAAQSTSTVTGTLANLCINANAQAAGQALTLGGCGSGWIPSPSVGPGAAALPQWINYFEFGRCLDVTAQDPNHAFLIDYPCKQNPFPGAKTWNQLFQAPANPTGISVTGQISTCNSSPATITAAVCTANKYCLTSPVSSGGYVTVQACGGGLALRQAWTIYGGDSSLNYSTKYTIVNNSLCLGLSVADSSLTDWSTIDVETCTGATEQKWNAVPNLLISALKNFREK